MCNKVKSSPARPVTNRCERLPPARLAGQTAMTAVGAVAGASASHHRQTQRQAARQIELTIKTQSGQLIQVLQPYDGQLTFNKGDKVRILTSGTNTNVDKSV